MRPFYVIHVYRLFTKVKFLQERLAEKEVNSGLPEPSTPNAYYEDKLKEMTQEADELRWKLIEKDREIERLTAVHVSKVVFFFPFTP